AGLWVTQLSAVGLNLVAAIGALRLAARTSAASRSAAAEVPDAITAADTMDVSVVKVPFSLTAVAILLSGFAAMGMEIVWFRHLSSLLGSFRSVLSLILTVILVGIWLGSLAGGYLHRLVGRPVVLYVVAQAVFVISALGALMAAETRGVLARPVLLGIVPLCVAASSARAPRKRRVAAVAAGSVLALGVAVIVWARLPADFLVNRTLWPLRPSEQRLVVSEGITDVVTVTEMPGEGRMLFTNGHSMSSTSVPAQRYMRAFVHIPLLSLDTPESVLVICFGVGNTAHAASLHPSLRRLEVVDTSRTVLAHADYFAATNGRVHRNANVTVFVNDGRQHLKMRPPATFDLITLEPPPIAFAGV